MIATFTVELFIELIKRPHFVWKKHHRIFSGNFQATEMIPDRIGRTCSAVRDFLCGIIAVQKKSGKLVVEKLELTLFMEKNLFLWKSVGSRQIMWNS